MLGVAQTCVKSCPKKNFVEISEPLTRKAKQLGCDLLCFPEAFDFLEVPGSGLGKEKASFLDGPLVHEYCSLAKEHSIWLSLGGIHEKVSDSTRIANTHLVINGQGEVVANYRKIHLFDANVEIKGGYKESRTTIPGDKLVAVDTPVGRVGLTICFDLRFPEVFQKLSASGCDVILVPSAFMPSTGAAHWHTLLRARAIENQVYIAAAAQAGSHNEKRSSYGHSLVVDPWGKVLVDLENKENEIAVIKIDKETITKVRERIPQSNKPDLSVVEVEIK